MILAAAQPAMLGPVILNDIGPVIEREGLTRIASYVGRTPLPRDWTEAAKLVRDMNVRTFPAVPTEDWEPIARQLFNEKNGRPAPGYDPKLAQAFSVLDGPMPALWPQFEALTRLPLMVIRGVNSDLLSEATVDEMRQRHPDLTELAIAGQGHAPWLRDAPSIAEIRRFLERTDAPHAA
jgi:pimeloyl-ACP methyl ester carboxylesterase